MRIVVTSSGAGGSTTRLSSSKSELVEVLDAQTNPAFGRCPTYVFVETETADEDHPLEFEVLDNPAVNAAGGAGIQAAQFVVERGAQAVVTGNVGPNAFNVLQSAGVPVYLFSGGTVREAVEAYKAGQLSTTGGASASAHAGMGQGTGMAVPVADLSREEEVTALKKTTGDLRRQLAEVMERLDQLERRE
jgi:predicted Fe-Mo cluster-binding NifX family protein